MSSLRSLVHSRKEVLESTLDESIFAANLATVLQGTAPPVYGEPAEFFSRTHPSSRLRALLNLCLGRFVGAQPDASPIIRTNTNLDGGKTHNLIVVDEIAQYLQKAGGVEVGNGTLADQTLTLLMALCEAAAQVPRTVLVLTTTRLECIQQRYREGRCLDDPRAGNHRLASLPYPAFGRGRSAFHVVWMLSRGLAELVAAWPSPL